jgi:peptidoglycan/xylan/chitin deacetylase (PgdA/CDA1 family)
MTMRFHQTFRGALLSALALVSRLDQRPTLRLFYLHGVSASHAGNFRAQIEALQKMGEFISATEVLAILRKEKPLDRRYFHLSFDDGFRDVLVNALPVLKSHEVPATMFVPTAIIPGDFPSREAFRAHVRRFPRSVATATWRELSLAREAGMEIGCHTRTHARLSAISTSPARLEDEILGSKAELERNLGAPCHFMAWPYGRQSDVDARALEVIKSAGFAASFGAFRGKVEPGLTDPFQIPRHHIEADWPLAHLKFFAAGGTENWRGWRTPRTQA